MRYYSVNTKDGSTKVARLDRKDAQCAVQSLFWVRTAPAS